MDDEALSPDQLATQWYSPTPPQAGWVVGLGDIFAAVPYLVRDPDLAGRYRAEPHLAVCVEHPCDAPQLPPRIHFARAWYLDEYLGDFPRAWRRLPAIAQGTALDYVLLPANPGRWEVDVLADLRDHFPADSDTFEGWQLLAHMRNGYWQTFGFRVAQRPARGGFVYPVPAWTLIQDSKQGVTPLDPAYFRMAPGPDEAAIVPPNEVLANTTRYVRPAARQDWWKVEWEAYSREAGYGLTLAAATERLVRVLRRRAAQVQRGDPSLDLEMANQVRAAWRKAGVTL